MRDPFLERVFEGEECGAVGFRILREGVNHGFAIGAEAVFDVSLSAKLSGLCGRIGVAMLGGAGFEVGVGGWRERFGFVLIWRMVEAITL